jgi:hypothetical protein
VSGVRLFVPRPAVVAITRLVLAGLALLFALAVSGCGPTPAEEAARKLVEASAKACRDGGGAARWRPTITGLRYDGCDFPPCPPTAFRPDYYPPAEAPEVTP